MNIIRNITIISFTTTLLAACGDKTPPPAQIRPFPTVAAESKTVTGFQAFPTSIQGIVNNDVRAKIQGYIKEVLVDEGQYVQQGQTLFRLETNTLSESANAAKSGISAAKSNVAAAQAAVEAAQVEVTKLEPLVQKNIISAVQLETAKANLLRAQSQLQQAKAGEHQASANYKSVAANVDYAVIKAPISGIVGKINFRTGSLVGPSDPTPITTISDTRKLYAYFSMNEAAYLDFLTEVPGKNITEKVKNLPLVDLVLANGSNYSEKGKIEAITGQIDPKTGTVQFRASFQNADGLLSNGNSGTIRLPKQYNDAIIIPESSTFEQQGLVYVYKVVNDTAKSTVVTVLDRVDNLAVIGKGLQQGDIIIANGVGKLKNNTPVKPTLITIDSVNASLKPIF